MVFSVTLATNHRVNSLCPVHVYVNGHVIFRCVKQMQVISETVLKLSVSKNTNVHVD